MGLSWIDLAGSGGSARAGAQAHHARLVLSGNRLFGTWHEGQPEADSRTCRWTLARLELRRDPARNASRDRVLADALGELADALPALAPGGSASRIERGLARNQIAAAAERVVASMPAKVHIESLLLGLARQGVALGHRASARRFAGQAAAIVGARLATEGIAVAGYVTSVAATLRALKLDQSAQALYRKADREIIRRGETRHEGYAAILSGYGAVLLAERQPQAAADVFARALKAETALDQSDGAGVRIALVNLAAALDALGRSSEASRLRERALAPSISGRRPADT
ncbi:MAG: tetratricopeptide repeat protein [Burkholderiaceae bacterium]